MRTIRGVALATYYAKGAEAAQATANSSSIRTLVYAVKNNRARPNQAQLVIHSRHPAAPAGVWVDRDNAIGYVAAIVARHLPRIRQRLGIEAGGAVLVPVPSSSVTKDTVESDRFPALKLARAYEEVGLGECRVAAINRTVVQGKTLGVKRTADEIFKNLVLMGRMQRECSVVFVDDLVTTGASLAAIDHLVNA